MMLNVLSFIYQKGGIDIKDINKIIALAVVNAQACSDAGKGINELSYRNASMAEHFGYDLKEEFIVKALKLIRGNKTAWHYTCVSCLDQNRHKSILVYFRTRVTGERIQISFHTPMNKASAELIKMSNSGETCYWTKSKKSLMGCKRLIEYYGL